VGTVTLVQERHKEIRRGDGATICQRQAFGDADDAFHTWRKACAMDRARPYLARITKSDHSGNGIRACAKVGEEGGHPTVTTG